MREDLANFVRSVSVYWILLMSGAFGLFATIIERATHNQQERSPVRKFFRSWIFIVACAASIFAAFFLAWRDVDIALRQELAKNSNAQQAIDGLTKGLNVAVKDLGCAPTGTNQNLEMVWASIEIFNKGRPTITHNWGLTVYGHGSNQILSWVKQSRNFL
jgi:hypothetical protein